MTTPQILFMASSSSNMIQNKHGKGTDYYSLQIRQLSKDVDLLTDKVG